MDEAPVDEAPVDEAPVDQAPVDEAPVDQTKTANNPFWSNWWHFEGNRFVIS